MRKLLLSIFVNISLLAFVSCDVHEWPDSAELVAVDLRVDFSTLMYEWEDGEVTDSIDVVQKKGLMRYNIKVYSGFAASRASAVLVKNVEFTRDLSEGYGCSYTLELPGGNYTVMVWADLIGDWEDSKPYYNAEDFTAIVLAGVHAGNTDYRDAFRGVSEITLETSDEVVPVVVHTVRMERPLAKYEFIANDFERFLYEEVQKKYKTPLFGSVDEMANRVGLDGYKAVFYYSGFMPCEYNMFIDKPVDSKLGVLFESKIVKSSMTEAKLGFDYVFVNGASASVPVQIGIYDEDGELVSLTSPINVPLKRNHHTLIRGAFLLQQASGGILIQPGFDGEHNVIVP